MGVGFFIVKYCKVKVCCYGINIIVEKLVMRVVIVNR